MKVAIGCDHGGYNLKQTLKTHLLEKGIEVLDVGTYSLDSCDYPIYGHKVGLEVKNGNVDFGIVVCTSGEGIMMAANKVEGVRAGLAYNDEVAALMRQHNNANVIGFGAKFIKKEDAIRRLDIFLSTDFEGGRHERRVDLIEKI